MKHIRKEQDGFDFGGSQGLSDVGFCNKEELFHFSYRRYLENQIRQTFGLEGTPVRFIIRERGEKN